MKEARNNFEIIFPKKNTIIMLHAHADDESFLAAGIISEFVIRKYNIILIYLAAGIVKKEKKTITRRIELSKSLSVLGVKNVEFLEYCEPAYSQSGKPLFLQSTKDISDSINRIINRYNIKNYTLFSYDKNGGYGNKDHLTVHMTGRLLFKNSLPQNQFFEITISRNIYRVWLEKNKNIAQKTYLPKLNYWAEEFGMEDKDINYFYSLNSEQIKLKRMSLSKHTSQVKRNEFPLSLSDSDFVILFGTEYFAQIKR